MFKFIVTVIICALMLSACRDSSTEIGFPIVATASPSPIYNIKTLCPSNIISFGDFLVTINSCEDTLISVFSKADFTSTKIGLKGFGPNEYTNLGFFGQYTQDYIRLIDHTKHQSFLLREGNYAGFELKPEQFLPNEIVLSENILVTKNGWVHSDLGGFSDGIITLIDSTMTRNQLHSDLLSATIQKPQLLFPNPYAYYHFAAYESSKDKIVLGFRYFPLIVVIDNEGNIIRKTRTKPIEQTPEFVDGFELPTNNANIYYWQVLSSANHIYALNANTDMKTFHEDDEESIRTSLEIYDWQLNPVCRIDFDAYFGSISIDFKRKKIYGLSPIDYDHLVCEVELPENVHEYFND